MVNEYKYVYIQRKSADTKMEKSHRHIDIRIRTIDQNKRERKKTSMTSHRKERNTVNPQLANISI